MRRGVAECESYLLARRAHPETCEAEGAEGWLAASRQTLRAHEHRLVLDVRQLHFPVQRTARLEYVERSERRVLFPIEL